MFAVSRSRPLCSTCAVVVCHFLETAFQYATFTWRPKKKKRNNLKTVGQGCVTEVATVTGEKKVFYWMLAFDVQSGIWPHSSSITMGDVTIQWLAIKCLKIIFREWRKPRVSSCFFSVRIFNHHKCKVLQKAQVILLNVWSALLSECCVSCISGKDGHWLYSVCCSYNSWGGVIHRLPRRSLPQPFPCITSTGNATAFMWQVLRTLGEEILEGLWWAMVASASGVMNCAACFLVLDIYTKHMNQLYF